MADKRDEKAAQAIDLAVERIDQLGQLRTPADLIPPCLLAYGWWVRVVRTCQAIKVVYEAGLDSEAAPLVRTAMHHAAALVWLSKEPEKASEAVKWQHWQKAQKLYGGAMARSWELADIEKKPKKAKGSPPGGVKYLESIEKLCDEFEMGNWYVGFMIESGFIHPSADGADAYLEPGEDGQTKLWTTSRVSGTPLRTTAVFLWAATNATAELLGDEGLRRLADELGKIINPDPAES